MIFMKRLAAAVALSCLASPVSAAPLPPTARWVVNFDDAQCVASREYGSEKKPLTLALKRPVRGEIIQLAVMREGSQRQAEQLKGEARFGNSPPLQASVLSYGTKQRVLLFNLPASEIASRANETSLAITVPSELSETLQLSGLQPLLKVMDECVAGLKQEWNVSDDPAAAPKLRTEARGNLATFFSSDDYPQVALARDQTGITEFVVLVDETGKVADCTVVATSGAASLDAQSCAVLKRRARLKAAIGLDGKPAKDAMRGRIRWKMP